LTQKADCLKAGILEYQTVCLSVTVEVYQPTITGERDIKKLVINGENPVVKLPRERET